MVNQCLQLRQSQGPSEYIEIKVRNERKPREGDLEGFMLKVCESHEKEINRD